LDVISFKNATSGASPVLDDVYNKEDVQPVDPKSWDNSAQDILKQIGNHQFMQSDCPEYTSEQQMLMQQHLDEKDDEYAQLINHDDES
jgi:hypothetical protein